MKLVDDWKDWPKWVSTWCEAAAAAFFTAVLIAPEVIMQVWAVLPADIRAAIPADWLKWGGIVLIAIGSLAKIVEQPRLREKRDA